MVVFETSLSKIHGKNPTVEQIPTVHFFQKNAHKTRPEVQCNILGKQDNVVALFGVFSGRKKKLKERKLNAAMCKKPILF